MDELKRFRENIDNTRYYWAGGILFIIAAALIIATWLGYNLVGIGMGPEQPLPFSHRVHATDKQISCVMCHQSAIDTKRAGIPPLATCLLCHQEVITQFPWIRKLREHFYARKPIEWTRLNTLPDFVFFDHSAHLNRGIDCGRCHGAVNEMDRLHQEQKFVMGFCIQCHRDNNATHDCFVCHH
jgi:hypothetical protein